MLTGGSAPTRDGWFYEPTVLAAVDPDDPLLDHEVFAPVAPIVRFSGDDDALALANHTEFGLAAYVYSGDLARVPPVAGGIYSGVVGVNRRFVSEPAAPFGGMKQTGLAREGSHAGLLEFVETKYIAASW